MPSSERVVSQTPEPLRAKNSEQSTTATGSFVAKEYPSANPDSDISPEDRGLADEVGVVDTAQWVRAEAEKAKVRPPEKKPYLELVPPVKEERPLQEAKEVASWVQREAAQKEGEAKRQEEAVSVSDLSVFVGRLRHEREQLMERVKQTEKPMRKAIEVLGKLGFFKDTLEAMRVSDVERAKLEQSLDTTERAIREAETTIERIATAQEARMKTQTKEIAQGSSPIDQALVEKWFYNRYTEGGEVSDEAREEWEVIERRARGQEITREIKGMDQSAQEKIKNWFEDPDLFVEEVDNDLEAMAKEDVAVNAERDAWHKNELPPDTKEAISARLAKLREETVLLERERNQLEDRIRKTLGGGQKPANFHELIRFDERLRSKYLGGWVRRLFGNRGAGAETFLILEPQLREKEAQFAINKEAIRRAELALKDPHAAVREAVVREIVRVERMITEKRKTPQPAGMPGSMRNAA